jgi:hypothetical protein
MDPVLETALSSTWMFHLLIVTATSAPRNMIKKSSQGSSTLCMRYVLRLFTEY